MPEELAIRFINEIKKAKEQKGDAFSFSDITLVLEKILNHTAASDKAIYDEIKSIATKIKDVKGNVAGIGSEKISKKFISDANLELDAVIRATAEATNKILDAAENIQKSVDKAPEEIKKPIVDKVTEIFEASTFQDITGQRIKKVVGVLVEIEKSVENLIGAMSGKIDISSTPTRHMTKEEKEKQLLNGPQISAPKQEDIDELFKSLDKKG